MLDRLKGIPRRLRHSQIYQHADGVLIHYCGSDVALR